MLGWVGGCSGRLGVGLEFTARGKDAARGKRFAPFFVMAEAMTYKELSRFVMCGQSAFRLHAEQILGVGALGMTRGFNCVQSFVSVRKLDD